MNLAEQPQSVRKLVPAKCMQQIYIQHSGRRHLQYSEITTSILCGIILDFLSLCVSVFPIAVRQLFEFLTTSQLTRRNVCAILKILHYFSTNWFRPKYHEGYYTRGEVRWPCMYFKGSEGVSAGPQKKCNESTLSIYNIIWTVLESDWISRIQSRDKSVTETIC